METVNRFLAVSLGSALVSLTPTARAANPLAESYSVLSNGYITCGEFLSDNPGSQAADAVWVLGYITGRNRDSPAGSRNAGTSFTAPSSVTAWLQNYCQTHALDRLVEAADALRAEFLRRERPH